MNEISYQNILNTVFQSLPEEWERMVLRVSFEEDVCEIIYYVRDKSGAFKDCYELGTLSQDLLNQFAVIHYECEKGRNSIPERKRWNEMILTIQCDGQFETEFVYEKIMTQEKEDNWRRTYLK